MIPRKPRQIDGNGLGQRHIPQFVFIEQSCGDDLAMIKLKFRQVIEPQFEEMNMVTSPVPNA